MSQSTKIICDVNIVFSLPCLRPRHRLSFAAKSRPLNTRMFKVYLALELVQVLDCFDLIIVAVIDGLCNLRVVQITPAPGGVSAQHAGHAPASNTHASTEDVSQVVPGPTTKARGSGGPTSSCVKPSTSMPSVRFDPPQPPAAGAPGMLSRSSRAVCVMIFTQDRQLVNANW